MEHPACAAVEAVSRAATSEELLRAVGTCQVAALVVRVDEAKAALEPGVHVAVAAIDPQCQQVAMLYELARQCLSLAGAADADVDDDTAAASGHMQGDDVGWAFGAEVAEVTANSLAAMAIGLDYNKRCSAHGVLDEWAMVFLERLSLDFDYFAAFMFGGLCRLGSQLQALNAKELRLLRALRGICVWVLWAVGHAIGYEHFSAKVLWEWASADPAWALVLVKGVLCTSFEDLASLQAPPGSEAADAPIVLPADLAELQLATLGAVLGLATPSIAFSSDVMGDQVPITKRNAELARHRSDLAAAAVSCQLPATLIDICFRKQISAGPRLVSFLVALFQPELIDDQVEADVLLVFSNETAEVVREAQRATAALTRQMTNSAERLWRLLIEVPAALDGELPAGFLQDCADLAHFVSPALDILEGFVNACLTCRSRTGSTPDAGAVAALCILSSNSDSSPKGGAMGNASPRLVEVLIGLAADARTRVLERWARWRGPVRLPRLGQWAAMLEAAPLLQGIQLSAVPPPPPMPDAPEPEAQPEPPPSPRAPPPRHVTSLRELIHDVPSEFRCAIDGQLMMDPVQSPQGLIFERMALAGALQGAICPITGEIVQLCPITGMVLQLEDCQRLPELRRRITRWVREQRSRPGTASRAQPQLAAAAAAR